MVAIEDNILTPAFITGSYAYGIVNDKSDVDVVMYVEQGDRDRLMQLCDSKGNSHEQSIRFGRLNLILLTDVKMYEAWLKGTNELMAVRPVSREVAVNKFQELFNAVHSLDDWA